MPCFEYSILCSRHKTINYRWVAIFTVTICSDEIIKFGLDRFIPFTRLVPTEIIVILGSDVLDMTMSLYLFLDMYLHSGEYHVGTVGIDIRNYIFAVLMR